MVLSHMSRSGTNWIRYVIEDIWHYLDEEGLAVVTESFSRVEDRFPTHLASNQKYAGKTDQLFVEEGFVLLESYPGETPRISKNRKDKLNALQFSTP